VDMKNIESPSSSLPQQPVIDRQLEPDLLISPNLDRDRQKLPPIRMAMPLLFQALLICSIPFQSVYALLTGTTVVLKTQPVDPYDILRGYYQTLSYDISSFETLSKLPGWTSVSVGSDRTEILARNEYVDLDFKRSWHNVINGNIQYGIEYDKLNVQFEYGEKHTYPAQIDRNNQVYITLLKTKGANKTELQAWKPVAVSKQLPSNLSGDKIAIRGTSDGNRIIYGLETYYMPENRKDSVNTDIDESRRSKEPRNLFVEVKVDNRGLATPVSLWVGKKEYHF
jgi:uncharacterized membrane-anchored protein